MAKTPYLTAPLKTDKMPPGVPFIIGNEAAERFSYYGVNGILVIFMTTFLMNSQGHLAVMSETEANGWYHTFVTCVYGLPLLGAFLADAVLGKFRTVFWLSIVYCFGHFALALNDTRAGLVIGLGLIALGAGGIKPCVSANVGDQFGPRNQHLLQRVYSWFYFSINIGSTFATILIPIFLHDKHLGPRVAFGVPGIAMAIATIIFFLGRKKFVHIPPAGWKYIEEFFYPKKMKGLLALAKTLAPRRPVSITVLSWLAISGGALQVCAGILLLVFTAAALITRSESPANFGFQGLFLLLSSILSLALGVGWLTGQNWARRFYFWLLAPWTLIAAGEIVAGVPIALVLSRFVLSLLGYSIFVFFLNRRPAVEFFKSRESFLNGETFKSIGNLLIPVPFVAMFWALWQQNFSSWVKQAEKLDRHMFGHEWLPEQIQTVNPGFVLLMLPLFSYVIYPLLGRVWRLTPLRKIGIGLFTNALAFSIVALIQQRLDAGARPHVMNQILAFVFLTAGEVMVSVTHLEFAYTQAPKKLKSLVMCTYLGAIALGNVFTAQVNFYLESHGRTEITAPYFWFFVKVMLVTAVLWLVVSPFYRGKTYIQDEAEG